MLLFSRCSFCETSHQRRSLQHGISEMEHPEAFIAVLNRWPLTQVNHCLVVHKLVDHLSQMASKALVLHFPAYTNNTDSMSSGITKSEGFLN